MSGGSRRRLFCNTQNRKIMGNKRNRRFAYVPLVRWVILLAFLVAGCAGTKETEEGEERRVARRQPPPVDRFEINLHEDDPAVRTVQLYTGSDESMIPILIAGSNEQLTLEFDVMGLTGRPLSVYFYHADREWKRDLSPPEYMASFQRDDLLDFTTSRATEANYVHYTYRFPNNAVGFRISGNYIVRVTEQGQEDAVLFERPFFVSEQSATPEMASQQVMVGGRGFPSIVPILQFMPPSSIAGSSFDYDVCFVQNGRIELARCTNEVDLAAQPLMRFYLQPEHAFDSDVANYYLDFRDLRVGGQIEDVDFGEQPVRVILEPDYASFPASGIAPKLNGQTVISGSRAVAEHDLSSEYANVRFCFVPPDEKPLMGDLYIMGSFNGWRRDPAYRMEWQPERARYEIDVLLKQGEYEYRYYSTDRSLQEHLMTAPPRSENLYTALIYYSDISLSTDRLIGVGGMLVR